MPAVSKSQQRLMAQAYQVKKYKETSGREGINPLEIEPEYRVEIEDLAVSMTMDQLKDYAKTPHTDLPAKKVKESGLTGFLSAGPFPRYNIYAGNVSSGHLAYERDKRDPLIKKFMEFIEGKGDAETVQESGAVAPSGAMATPGNTPGMGNVTAPSQGTLGSGDKFGDNDEEDVNARIGIMSYEDYKKWLKKWQKQKQQ